MHISYVSNNCLFCIKNVVTNLCCKCCSVQYAPVSRVLYNRTKPFLFTHLSHFKTFKNLRLKLRLALAVFRTILPQKCRFVIWNIDIQITFKYILFVSQTRVKFCFAHVAYFNLLSWLTSNSMLRVAKAPSQFFAHRPKAYYKKAFWLFIISQLFN